MIHYIDAQIQQLHLEKFFLKKKKPNVIAM